jgi:hypothetical protein
MVFRVHHFPGAVRSHCKWQSSIFEIVILPEEKGLCRNDGQLLRKPIASISHRR